MRILICGINFSPELTGIGKYTGELAEYLAQAGHEIRVVTAPPYYPQWKVLPGYSRWKYKLEREKGITIYRCPLWVPERPRGLSRIIHLTSFALSSLPPLLLQLAWKPQLVISIAPAILSAPFALSVAKLSGAKSYLHIQDFELDAASSLGLIPVSESSHSFLNKIETRLYRGFDWVTTISQAMASRLYEKGVAEEAVILFPNWVDTQAICPQDGFNSFRSEMNILEDKLVILYSGNMGRKQGLEILVEAATRLVDEPDIIFVLCGDGAARSDIESQANGLPNIIFIPLQPVSKLNALLNLADIHVLPQRAGAADLVMPSKLAGMLASGRPVIATAQSGSELFSVLSKVGMIVPPEDAQQFVNAIRFLAADPAERTRLGMLGRKFVEANWDKVIVLSSFLEQFKIDPNRSNPN